MPYTKEILLMVFCYAMGCVCVGYYLTHWRTGRDVRTVASRSVGARNVGRVLGKTGFIITLIGDFSKGACAMWMVQAFDVSALARMAAMLMVLIGHIWPMQLGFHGGKGVAVTLGVLALFDMRLPIGLVGVFSLAWLVTGRYIVSGLFALATLPVMAFAFGHTIVEIAGIVLMTGLILLAHRSNIREIIRGNRMRKESCEA